jgi:hypothetical protein
VDQNYGLLRGVAFGVSGVTRGMAFVVSGVTRGVVFGVSGATRGVAFGVSGGTGHSLITPLFHLISIFSQKRLLMPKHWNS